MIRVTVDSSALETSYKKKLAEAPKEAKQAFSRMLRDTEKHAQMVVARQIAEIYTISAADVKRTGISDVSVKVSGQETVLVYRGRTLTWHHFKYSPRMRTLKRQPVKGAIKKAGGLKPAGERAFIGGTGTVNSSKVQSIPFWRVGKKRKPIKAIHGPSVPQMVLNEKEVVPVVLDDLGPYMLDRFEHHFGWYTKKE